jgi:hypothetical protein
MRKSNTLTISGTYSEGDVLPERIFTDIYHSKYCLDGYKLKEFAISCVIYTPQDVDALIELLTFARYGLHTQGINHNSNFTDGDDDIDQFPVENIAATAVSHKRITEAQFHSIIGFKGTRKEKLEYLSNLVEENDKQLNQNKK